MRAAIYVAGRLGRRQEDRCLERCEQGGYELVALVRDDTTGIRFGEVAGMAMRGEIDVMVTPSLSLLPQDRVPRIETLDTPAPVRGVAPVLTRRPRPLD